MDILENLNWRYATKSFDKDKKIDDETYEKIKDVLILSPSSFGLQPWKFLLIRDEKTKELLRPASWEQIQITDCDVLAVLCYKKDMDETYIDSFLKSISQTRNKELSYFDSYKQMMMGALVNNSKPEKIRIWAEQQVYIALGNLMTSCAVLGVDTCAIGGFSSEEYDKILNLKDTEYGSSVVCAIGYRSKDDKYATLKKVRFNESDLIEEI